jgi:hypothetical protein
MSVYNRFNQLPYVPYQIISYLAEQNDRIFKLLKYNDIDALNKPNLTMEQKRQLIWDGQDDMENYNIFLTNVQPNEEIKNRTIMKVYRYNMEPDNQVSAIACYRFDILFGSKIPLVTYNGITCNRGDVIEMEIMRSLNGEDVAGVGFLQYNNQLTTLCSSQVGIGNNYTFTGLTIVMGTNITDIEAGGC